MSDDVNKSFRISWTAYLSLITGFTIVISILLAVFTVVAIARFGDGIVPTALTNYEFIAKAAKWIAETSKSLPSNAINIAFWIFFALIVLDILKLIYSFIYLRNIRLYTDENGVWVYRGVFPWQKGSYGVKWRDLDSASYFTSFLSWLLRTYDIRIDHRYTKDNEITLSRVFNGHRAVAHINATHQEFVKSNQEAAKDP
ncbi:MAG: hypothetical protein LBO72_04455 [Helicobacteraceae bacterium]|jgi:hypothetical protein|nr:hypothetical protein [Helicobacteraceae bacterium]